MVSLPPSLQVTLTWGASTLWTKQVELPCDLEITEVGGRLLGDRAMCELRTATAVQPIRAERRLRTQHGELELLIDAVTDDIAPALPSSIDPRRAAFDLGSMVLHLGVGLMLFLLADPLAAELKELPDQAMIHTTVEPTILFGESTSTRTPDEEPGGHRAVDKRPPGAAGPGASTQAALGEPRQPNAGGNAIASRQQASDGLAQIEAWSMISLLAHANAGAADRSNGGDAWSGAGLESGPSWGDPGGIGADGGVGGLALSGVGEGGGSHSEGINLGPGGVGTCGVGCKGTQGGLVMGSHTGVKIGAVNICGARYLEGVKISGTDCSTTVSGRLPPDAIQRIVRQNFGRFRLCYEKDLQTQPSLLGRVSVSFTIGRDGTVSGVAASAEGMPSTTAACVAKSFSGISFPQPEGGVVRVTYPIVFSPG